MGLYNRVTGSTGNETRIKEPKPFKPIELEQALRGAYSSYRINGKPKMDVDTFFNPIQYGLFLKHYGMGGGHYGPPCNFGVS